MPAALPVRLKPLRAPDRRQSTRPHGVLDFLDRGNHLLLPHFGDPLIDQRSRARLRLRFHSTYVTRHLMIGYTMPADLPPLAEAQRQVTLVGLAAD